MKYIPSFKEAKARQREMALELVEDDPAIILQWLNNEPKNDTRLLKEICILLQTDEDDLPTWRNMLVESVIHYSDITLDDAERELVKEWSYVCDNKKGAGHAQVDALTDSTDKPAKKARIWSWAGGR